MNKSVDDKGGYEPDEKSEAIEILVSCAGCFEEFLLADPSNVLKGIDFTAFVDEVFSVVCGGESDENISAS